MTAYDKFAASLFNCSSQSKVDFLKNELNTFTKRLDNQISPVVESLRNSCQWLKDKMVQTHEKLFNSSKLNEVRSYLMENGNSIQDGFLHKLNLVNYRCNVDTKEFILNHPMVFRFHKYGFLNEFNGEIAIDRSVSIPEFRKEYIKTFDGVVKTIGDKPVVRQYYSIDPKEQVSWQELTVRMEIWDTVSQMLSDGLDPTEERK